MEYAVADRDAIAGRARRVRPMPARRSLWMLTTNSSYIRRGSLLKLDTDRGSKMDVQLVIGAGAIGTATAQLLADRAEPVRLVTRSGGGPEHPAIERIAADASDADALSRPAEGVGVVHRWA